MPDTVFSDLARARIDAEPRGNDVEHLNNVAENVATNQLLVAEAAAAADVVSGGSPTKGMAKKLDTLEVLPGGYNPLSSTA